MRGGDTHAVKTRWCHIKNHENGAGRRGWGEKRKRVAGYGVAGTGGGDVRGKKEDGFVLRGGGGA